MAVALVRGDLLYAWKGPAVLVTTGRGECGDDQTLSGFYYREARFLRTFRLEVNGRAVWLCEAAMVRPDLLEFTYVHPEITQPGGGGTGQSGDEEGISADGLPERSLDIRVSFHVRAGRLDVAVGISNRARQPLTFDLACVMDADFADIQEAQVGRRQQEANVDAAAGDDFVEFRYRHPSLPYRTEAAYAGGWKAAAPAGHEGPPYEVRHEALAGHKGPPYEARHEGSPHSRSIEGVGRPFMGRLMAHLTLAPQQSHDLAIRIVPFVAGEAVSDREAHDRETILERWRAAMTRITVPGNRLFERVLDSNIRDIASYPLLDGARDEWLAMQAGMPVYPAFFGRDAVTAGWQAALLDRGEALDSALTKLGRMQSQRVDDWHDEQPGRIPYQMRTGPLAILDINPYSAYYADFASPLMYVISLGNLYAWTGDLGRVRRHWDTVRRIVDWARQYGDPDGDGYLEYQTRSRKGTKNQGWKDSGDAIIYDDGSPVPSPIATCEVQGYWYVAQELMALLSVAMGARSDAAAHWRSAAALKARFNRDWWIEEEQFFGLALDPEKRLVRAVTSNVGHCVATGIIDAGHLPAVVGRLFAPDLFSGWGVRTLSSSHAFYNPLSYHRGTVWAVEQGTIIFGLRRFGFDARALALTHALFDLSLLYPEYRIPECIGGYARGERATPGAYPRANTPQLWNATAFPLVLQSMLGLLPLAPIETLIVDPVLPTWMPEIVLNGLRVGDAQVSLRFWREADGRSQWDVLHKRGTLRIVRQPPPESLTAGFGDRMTGLFETLAS